MTHHHESSRPPSADVPSAGETISPGQAGEPPPTENLPARPNTWGGVVGPDALPIGTRTWELFMPAGMELLNANARPHWAQRARITKDLRWTAYVMARKARIPALGRVAVWCIYEPPATRAVRDVANLAPSAKALVDGALVDAKVITDDSDAYLVGPDMRRGSIHPQGRLVLLIAELPPPNPEESPR